MDHVQQVLFEGELAAAVQLEVIFSILLCRYMFDLVDAPETYTDDHSRMIVLPRQPCRVCYRAR